MTFKEKQQRMGEQRGVLNEITVYVLACLVFSNMCWYLGYSNPNADSAAIFIIAASYLPMFLALVVTQITKEGWNNLGVAFHIKESWEIYVLSVLATLVIMYSAYPFMPFIFGKKVSVIFSLKTAGEICLMTVLGILCLIECLGEELGWIGYLFPKLEKIAGTVVACIVLGIVRGIYHIGILIFMEYPVQGFIEITVSNICLSFLMIYMFKKSKSIFPCSIHHGIANLLPVFLKYDNSWYYTSVLPMVVCIIPAALFGGYGFWQMKRQKMICNVR
ncbi:MAG: type II CAAX endopeptidase family protein [Eubacteriales bacterium]|nr:type II CAAX endopeptidase family protein [Eubacteriales bacterium]